MAVTVTNLVPGQSLPIGGTTLYTAVGTSVLLDKVTVCNYSAAIQSFTMHLVPSGGTSDFSNAIIVNRVVLGNDTYLCPEAVGHVLNAGDSVVCSVSDDLSLSIRISGRIVT
jgi:ADP-glucose pyrophosphorylase